MKVENILFKKTIGDKTYFVIETEPWFNILIQEGIVTYSDDFRNTLQEAIDYINSID